MPEQRELQLPFGDAACIQAILDAGDIGLWEYDHRGGRLRWSHAVAAMLGCKEKEARLRAEREWMEWVHPEDRERLEAARVSVAASLDLPFRMRRPDGRWRWLLCRGRVVERDGVDRPLRSVGTLRDISERRQAEEEMRRLTAELERRVDERTAELEATARDLRQSQQRYRSIVETVQEGIWVIDAQARTSFANRTMAQMLGYTVEEMAGRPLLCFMDEEWQTVARGHLRRRARGIAERHDFKFRRKDGTALWTLVSTNPLVGEDGRYAGALGLVTDITDRKRNESLNRKLAGIIEAGIDLIATATPGGRVDYMNQAGRALLGIGAAESLEGSRIEDYHPAWAYHRVMEEGIPMALAEGRWLGETTLLRRDGTEIPVSQLILTQRDRDTGQIEFLSTICRDLSEQRETAETLRRLQEEQALILDSVPALIFYKDVHNRILRVNATVAKSLNLPKDAIEGRHSIEFYPEDAHRYFQDDLAVIRSGLPRLGIEEPYRLPSGEMRWVQTDKVPLKDSAGQVTRVLVMATDITDRKRAEETLRLTQDDLNRAQAVAKIGSWRVDVRRNVLTCSAEYYRIFGIPPGTPISYQTFLSAVHPEDRDDVDRTWRAALGSRPRDIEHRLIVGGQLKWVSEKAELEFNDQGELTGLFGTTQDITDRKLAEAALREADRRKDEFIATLAHELRNPLAPIESAAEILHQSQGDAARQAWCCDVIERQVGHLTKLVDDLLDLSRITHGKISLQKEFLSVGDIVQRAAETSRPLLEAHRHHFSLHLPPEPLHLEGDLVRLAQVVSNVLNNAAKYTEPEGRIELSIERQGGAVVIRVRDNGIGIPPSRLPRVFDMFAQIDPSSQKSHGGLGIGLNLSQQLVALHGGTITAYSEGEGHGSEFVIRLPLAPARSLGASHDRTPLESSPCPHRVLVVDDNQDAGDSLAILLQGLGHRVRIARNGLEGVAVAAEYRPEFILMDIGMPKLNGYDACRRIRAQPWGREMVIVALTGWGQVEDKHRSHEAGFTHHLVKPVSLRELQRLLDALPPGPTEGG